MMDIDIQTEHAVMCPEWHRMIDAWVDRCTRIHPEVVGLDLTLRHHEGARADEVDVLASTRRRCLQARAHGGVMTDALAEALETLDRELLRGG